MSGLRARRTVSVGGVVWRYERTEEIGEKGDEISGEGRWRLSSPNVGANAAYEIRCATDADLDDHAKMLEQGYGYPPPYGARHADMIRAAGLTHRVFGAYERGRLLATLTQFPFGQFFGGRPVPMGGIGAVVVLPEHRGRGIASTMLEHAVNTMRDHGEVVSALGPATIGVYRRAGWELAGDRCWYSIVTRALDSLDISIAQERRAVRGDHDSMKRVYLRWASIHPGYLARPAYLWDRRLDLDVGSYCYVATRNDAVVGYVIYTQRRSRAGYSIIVDDIAALDWDAERCLWRHLGAHRAQATSVVIQGLVPDALLLHLPEESLSIVHQHQWMLRILDVRGAVAARGFNVGVAGTLAFHLSDPLVEANNGLWTLAIADGRGVITPGGSGSVEISINGLAALYSGMHSARTLATNGFIHGATPDQLGLFDGAFGGPRPSMSDDF